MTQVFIPESTVGVSLGFNQLVPMWLCIRGRISLSLASLGVGMWLARPKKRSKEMLSRGATRGVQTETLLKTSLTGAGPFF